MSEREREGYEATRDEGDSLEVIGSGAFWGCSTLKLAILPDSITRINDRTFLNCTSLRQVILPSTVQAIGREAFSGCSKLEKVDLSDSIETIGENAFEGCESLEKIIIPAFVTVIAASAFSGCTSLQEVILPSTIQSIGDEAFLNCWKLDKINLPDAIESIHSNAFHGCINLPIDTIKLPSSIEEKMRNDVEYDIFKNIRQNPWLPSTIEKQRKNLILKEGPGADPDFGGKTQRGYGPEWWALSREQLEDFKTHPSYKSITMREFVKQVLERITDGLGIGYALFVNQGEPLRAVIMISHAWDEPLHEFVENILRSGTDGPFWVCATAIYQNMDESKGVTISQQLGPVPKRSPLVMVLKNVHLMLLIITSGCDIYSRLWCVYDLFIALQKGVDVKLCPFIDENDLKMGHLQRDECIANAGVRVFSEAARCGNPRSEPNADELAIRETIEQSVGKFRSVDEAVEFFRFLYLIDYPTEEIEERVTSARDTLKVAIELILSRLPFREQTMKYNAFVQHQLSENQGFHIMERPDNVDEDEYKDGHYIGVGLINYHYIISDSSDTKIETFAAWCNYLKEQADKFRNKI